MSMNFNDLLEVEFVQEFCIVNKLTKFSFLGKLYLYNDEYLIEIYPDRGGRVVFFDIYLVKYSKYFTINDLLTETGEISDVASHFQSITKDYVKSSHLNISQEKKLFYYFEVFTNSFSKKIRQILPSWELLLRETSSQRRELFLSIIKGEVNPNYFRLSVSNDSSIMGVSYPQIPKLDPKSKLSSSEFRFPNNVNLPDHVPMDMFLAKSGAKRTDFMSSDLLKTNGFFISERLSEILRTCFIRKGSFLNVEVNKNYDGFKLQFVNLVEDGDIINFRISKFKKKSLNSSTSQETSFLNYDHYEKEVQRTFEEQLDYRIYPSELYLNHYADLFHLPLSNIFMISKSCLEILYRNEIVGYDIYNTDYSIF